MPKRKQAQHKKPNITPQEAHLRAVKAWRTKKQRYRYKSEELQRKIAHLRSLKGHKIAHDEEWDSPDEEEHVESASHFDHQDEDEAYSTPDSLTEEAQLAEQGLHISDPWASAGDAEDEESERVLQELEHRGMSPQRTDASTINDLVYKIHSGQGGLKPKQAAKEIIERSRPGLSEEKQKELVEKITKGPKKEGSRLLSMDTLTPKEKEDLNYLMNSSLVATEAKKEGWVPAADGIKLVNGKYVVTKYHPIIESQIPGDVVQEPEPPTLHGEKPRRAESKRTFVDTGTVIVPSDEILQRQLGLGELDVNIEAKKATAQRAIEGVVGRPETPEGHTLLYDDGQYKVVRLKSVYNALENDKLKTQLEIAAADKDAVRSKFVDQLRAQKGAYLLDKSRSREERIAQHTGLGREAAKWKEAHREVQHTRRVLKKTYQERGLYKGFTLDPTTGKVTPSSSSKKANLGIAPDKDRVLYSDKWETVAPLNQPNKFENEADHLHFTLDTRPARQAERHMTKLPLEYGRRPGGEIPISINDYQEHRDLPDGNSGTFDIKEEGLRDLLKTVGIGNATIVPTKAEGGYGFEIRSHPGTRIDPAAAAHLRELLEEKYGVQDFSREGAPMRRKRLQLRVGEEIPKSFDADHISAIEDIPVGEAKKVTSSLGHRQMITDKEGNFIKFGELEDGEQDTIRFNFKLPGQDKAGQQAFLNLGDSTDAVGFGKNWRPGEQEINNALFGVARQRELADVGEAFEKFKQGDQAAFDEIIHKKNPHMTDDSDMEKKRSELETVGGAVVSTAWYKKRKQIKNTLGPRFAYKVPVIGPALDKYQLLAEDAKAAYVPRLSETASNFVWGLRHPLNDPLNPGTSGFDINWKPSNMPSWKYRHRAISRPDGLSRSEFNAVQDQRYLNDEVLKLAKARERLIEIHQKVKTGVPLDRAEKILLLQGRDVAKRSKEIGDGGYDAEILRINQLVENKSGTSREAVAKGVEKARMEAEDANILKFAMDEQEPAKTDEFGIRAGIEELDDPEYEAKRKNFYHLRQLQEFQETGLVDGGRSAESTYAKQIHNEQLEHNPIDNPLTEGSAKQKLRENQKQNSPLKRHLESQEKEEYKGKLIKESLNPHLDESGQIKYSHATVSTPEFEQMVKESRTNAKIVGPEASRVTRGAVKHGPKLLVAGAVLGAGLYAANEYSKGEHRNASTVWQHVPEKVTVPKVEVKATKHYKTGDSTIPTLLDVENRKVPYAWKAQIGKNQYQIRNRKDVSGETYSSGPLAGKVKVSKEKAGSPFLDADKFTEIKGKKVPVYLETGLENKERFKTKGKGKNVLSRQDPHRLKDEDRDKLAMLYFADPDSRQSILDMYSRDDKFRDRIESPQERERLYRKYDWVLPEKGKEVPKQLVTVPVTEIGEDGILRNVLDPATGEPKREIALSPTGEYIYEPAYSQDSPIAENAFFMTPKMQRDVQQRVHAHAEAEKFKLALASMDPEQRIKFKRDLERQRKEESSRLDDAFASQIDPLHYLQ